MRVGEFQPMLAEKAKLEKLVFPLWASFKLDGIRALIKDSAVWSRALIAIPNRYTQDLFGCADLNGLDAELCVGPPNAPDLMQRTSSGLNSQDGEPDVRMYVFDYWTEPNRPYYDRLRSLQYGMDAAFQERHPRVILLEQRLIQNLDELDQYERDALDQGYEGIMIRKYDGLYKFGRSTANQGHLLKLKRMSSSEAVVIGFIEQYHNANEATVDNRGYTKRSSHQENMVPKGTLGAFMLRDLTTGIEFKCGIGKGMTDKFRQWVWDNRERLVNEVCTYESFTQTGVKEKPRIPGFKAFRNRWDMS